MVVLDVLIYYNMLVGLFVVFFSILGNLYFGEINGIYFKYVCMVIRGGVFIMVKFG